VTPRLSLLLVWLISYIICVVNIFLFPLFHESLLSNTQQYLRDVTGLYVPYLTPIVAFWFSEDVVGPKRTQGMISAVAALIISVFFNLVMICLLSSVFFANNGENVIEDTIKLMTSTGTLLAFLVGPAIGFFFSRTRATSRPGGSSRQNATRKEQTGAAKTQPPDEDVYKPIAPMSAQDRWGHGPATDRGCGSGRPSG
jgi:hypothetical protein